MRARWYLDRLRAMTPAEVVHRVRALVPRRAHAVDISRWKRPELGFEIAGDLELADMILGGERELLGLGRARVPFVADDPRLAYELDRGHDWVAVAAVADRDPRYRSWLEHALRTSSVPRSAMEAAIRIHSLIVVAALTDLDVAPMIAEHVAGVTARLSAHSSANNHLVVELSALVVAARALGLPAPIEELERAVAQQVFPDGVHAEMATHYHAFVLEALVLVGHPFEATIAAMADYLASLRCADGSLLQQGDDDGGRIIPGFVLPAGTARSGVFRSSGQVILRSPRLHAAFDAGPFGFGSIAAHAHCDALAIYVACDGMPLLVDRGTYRYAGDNGLRDRLRATAAHNTLQVDALEQGTMAGPFLWKRKPRVRLEDCSDAHAIGSHDGFAPATHRRTLTLRGDSLHVIDHANTALPITARFHFPPGVPVELRSGLAITPRGSIAFEGAGQLVATPHSSRYGLLESAITLEVRGLVEMAFVITPPGA